MVSVYVCALPGGILAQADDRFEDRSVGWQLFPLIRCGKVEQAASYVPMVRGCPKGGRLAAVLSRVSTASSSSQSSVCPALAPSPEPSLSIKSLCGEGNWSAQVLVCTCARVGVRYQKVLLVASLVHRGPIPRYWAFLQLFAKLTPCQLLQKLRNWMSVLAAGTWLWISCQFGSILTWS